jgi:cytochrome d ubiquinol oxidase subunit I
MRNEMVSFAEVALSPFAIDKFCHTVISAWIIGAVFTVAVSCWYLLKGRERKLAVESVRIGAIVGLVASVGAALTGHQSAARVAEVQPMKLAAMEALYNGGTDQSLTGIALINPFVQPDYENDAEAPMRIAVPYALSMLATNDPHGYVAGINDILNGYTKPDGTQELPVEEKMARGRKAIEALAAYRQAKFASSDDGSIAAAHLQVLQENMPYFGYGYIRDRSELVPFIPINFYAFRVMVGVGCLLILFFMVMLFFVYKKDLGVAPRWMHWTAIVMVPLAYIASESGWLVAEFGRQPWTIQDMLPTCASVSDLASLSVIITFFVFLVLFTTMLAVEINILMKQIKKGPEWE